MNKELVYLVQTDTTVGFSSSSDEKLSLIKQRPSNQKILQTVESFETLKKFTRVPSKFKRRVRNSKNTTYIYPNNDSFRKIDNTSQFYDFIKKFNILYSSSANITKKGFDEEFAISACDVVVFTKDGFFEDKPSSIIKINNQKLKRLR